MWLFDWFRPSSNFAKWIKLICQRLEISINMKTQLSPLEMRLIYSYACSILARQVPNPGVDENILRDIYNYFRGKFYWYESQLQLLTPEKQDLLLESLFWNKDILEFTYDIMNLSTQSKWLSPNQIFWDQDIQIIDKIYWN